MPAGCQAAKATGLQMCAPPVLYIAFMNLTTGFRCFLPASLTGWWLWNFALQAFQDLSQYTSFFLAFEQVLIFFIFFEQKVLLKKLSQQSVQHFMQLPRSNVNA